MLAKTFLVVFLTTLTVSLAKEDVENELLTTSLNAGTNVLKDLVKLVTDDDKYSLDFNSLYKKYEIANKAEQAKSFLQSQYKKGAELTNELIKKADIDSEEQLKKSIEIIKKEDPVLAEKLNKLYEKTCEIDRISEDIVKYALDVDKLNGVLDKFRSALHPLEHKLIDGIKKFEAIILEHIPKKSKGKQ